MRLIDCLRVRCTRCMESQSINQSSMRRYKVVVEEACFLPCFTTHTLPCMVTVDTAAQEEPGRGAATPMDLARHHSNFLRRAASPKQTIKGSPPPTARRCRRLLKWTRPRRDAHRIAPTQPHHPCNAIHPCTCLPRGHASKLFRPQIGHCRTVAAGSSSRSSKCAFIPIHLHLGHAVKGRRFALELGSR